LIFCRHTLLLFAIYWRNTFMPLMIEAVATYVDIFRFAIIFFAAATI